MPGGHDDDISHGVGHDRCQLRRGQHRREGDGHDAGPQRPEEPRQPGGLVVEQENDPFRAAHPELGQRVLRPKDLALEVGVGQPGVAAHHGEAVAVTGVDMAVDQPGGRVVRH